jgi:penicillin amidase
MRILKTVLIVILSLLLLATAAAYLYLNSLTPQYSGEIKVKGLQSTVNTYTDDFGIPHIYAESEEDAYLALGYLHAQERLFQMDFLRRLGGGRLAAILGEELVMVDKFFRTIGLSHMAERAVREHHADTSTQFHQAATAYLKGVNEFMENGPSPIEFTLLGIPKEKFELSDCYIISGYMTYSFSAGFTTDPLLSYIAEELGEAYLNDLTIHWPKSGTRIPVYKRGVSSAAKHLQRQQQIAAMLDKYRLPALQGSNGWVLAPSRSSSGSVLFENDAHINYSQPSTWFEAHLEYPGQSFYGNFLAGFPFALIGHNRNLSWGFTMFLNDDLDLYQEKVNPQNSRQVWVNDYWEDLELREEHIQVKDGENINLQVKISRHGPMLGQVLAKDQNIRELDSADLSVWWTYHKFTSRHLELSYRMSRAKNMETFRSIMPLIHAPGLNVMYGDRHGNIAWWAAAKLVKRPGHVNSKLVLDGASGKDEPLGFYDFSINPMSENPPSGFVYSANNQPDSIDNILYPGYYVPDNRALRIEQMLSEKNDWTIDDFKEMVLDDVSVRDRETAATLVAIIEGAEGVSLSQNQQQALDYLKKWNGTHERHEAAPAIYYRWLTRILKMTLQDELGKDNYNLLSTSMLLKRSYAHLIRLENSVWWDDIATQKQEKRATILHLAFEETIRDLSSELGNDPAQWSWGKVSQLEHEHVVGRQEPLNHIFNVGPFSVSGGQEVINNKDFFLKDTNVFDIRNGPAMRILIDFAQVEDSYSINPTGQSGFFMSPHYDDQAALYNTGKFRKQMMNREEIMEKSRKLVLKPQAD